MTEHITLSAVIYSSPVEGERKETANKGRELKKEKGCLFRHRLSTAVVALLGFETVNNLPSHLKEHTHTHIHT